MLKYFYFILDVVSLFYFNMEPRLKWSKKYFNMVTSGGGSDLKVFKIILLQHGTMSEMK